MAISVPESRQALAASQVNDLLAEHWATVYPPDVIAGLRQRFAAEDVVVLPGACPPRLPEPMRAEACHIIARRGPSHRLTFAITDHTPRQMTTAGQPIIKAEGPLIDAFYFAPELL